MVFFCLGLFGECLATLRECKRLEDRGFTFSVLLHALPRNWEDLFCVSLKECRFVCTK